MTSPNLQAKILWKYASKTCDESQSSSKLHIPLVIIIHEWKNYNKSQSSSKLHIPLVIIIHYWKNYNSFVYEWKVIW